jgi:hypothetical protein
MRYKLTEIQAAYYQLLALPDPPEMPRRSHRVTRGGREDRYRLMELLIAAYAAHLQVQWESRLV